MTTPNLNSIIRPKIEVSPPAGAAWQRTAAFPGGGDVICHNDLAPWNTAFADEQPIAFIDWDLAAPGPRWWDVSYALWHFVPLYGDPGSDPFDLAQFEPRARRTRLFCDAYGLDDRGGLVGKILERQRAVHTAIKHGAESGDPAYQRLWKLGAGMGIERQIDYVRAHRSALEDALT
jgi:aminoglycoside phosphotransferase (APT) family kinase protein